MDETRSGRSHDGRFRLACKLIEETRDIIDCRGESWEVPAYCSSRGYTDYLAQLSEAHLEAAEQGGLRAVLENDEHAPASLVTLIRAVEQVVQFPRFGDQGASARPPRSSERRLGDRKRAQVSAFVHATMSLVHSAQRVVDIGSGHGHLTRELSVAFAVEAKGYERGADRVRVAESLRREEPVEFIELDILESGLSLSSGDLAVGLHACGELGDSVVKAGSSAGAAIALVGCCLQKIRAQDRAPLSVPWGVSKERLVLPREILGLSNMTMHSRGIEQPTALNQEARKNRVALNVLFRLRGVETRFGEEMRGINRRRAYGTFEELAQHVFRARGLAAPTDSELHAAFEQGTREHQAARRFALPRSYLGRLLETYVLLDRASFLETQGYQVHTFQIFPTEVSPRNLALIATSN